MDRLSSRHSVRSSASRLLQLPGELRNQILRYIVTQPEPIDLCNRNHDGQNHKPSFNIDLRIMLVCKQLRDESRFFLYHCNSLVVSIDSTSRSGTITSLHFSPHHSICEYRAKEAVQEVKSMFLQRFSRFQFRFLDARQLDSLRRVINDIRHLFHNKRIEILLPPKGDKYVTTQRSNPLLSRAYQCPRITNPLASFSTMRCASMSVTESAYAPSDDLVSHQKYEKFVELVTSNKPVLDMAKEYDNAQRSARSAKKMIIPEGCFELSETLALRLFARLQAMCNSANASDQDAFVAEQVEFESCYRELEQLQWRTV